MESEKFHDTGPEYEESVIDTTATGSGLLRKAWERTSSIAQKGGIKEQMPEPEIEKTPRVRSYLELKKMMEHLPETIPENIREIMQDTYVDTLDSASRYAVLVYQYEMARKEGDDRASRENMQPIDEARRRTHDGLITNLNVILRLATQYELDISWKNDVGYGSRTSIREWAEEVSQYIGRIKEKQYNA